MTATAREARRAALWSSGLDVVAGLLAAIALRGTVLPSWPMLQFAAVGAVCLAVLVRWKEPPRWVSLALLNVNFASGLILSLVTSDIQARLGRPADLFNSIKISMFVIALVSCSLPLGGIWIATFAAAAVALWLQWPASIARSVADGDPWITLVYGAVALGLLLHRMRTLHLERALAREQAERVSAERLTEMSLAVQDLANTPLQTLTTGLDLLSAPGASPEKPIASMRRALARLRALRDAVARLESDHAWQRKDESFDALERLEALAETKQHRR